MNYGRKRTYLFHGQFLDAVDWWLTFSLRRWRHVQCEDSNSMEFQPFLYFRYARSCNYHHNNCNTINWYIEVSKWSRSSPRDFQRFIHSVGNVILDRDSIEDESHQYSLWLKDKPKFEKLEISTRPSLQGKRQSNFACGGFIWAKFEIHYGSIPHGDALSLDCTQSAK